MQTRPRSAIITLSHQGFSNYGNKLQNYAVKKVLEDLDISTDTYVYLGNSFIVNICALIQLYIPSACRRVLLSFVKSKSHWSKPSFAQFQKKLLSPKLVTNRIVRRNFDANKYNLYVIGSDQVWNPDYFEFKTHSAADYFFLSFCKPDQRLCFSPSFGRDEMPDELKPSLSQKLLSYNILSVREQSGIDIIKKLTDKDAFHMIDPTLMLTRGDWLEIAKPHLSSKQDKYLLELYYLGGPTKLESDKVKRIAQKNNLRVLALNRWDCPDLVECGPEQFIDLLSNAECVATNSFHATMFSIIFHKPIIIVPLHKKTETLNRFQTVYEMLSLPNRNLSNLDEDAPLYIDYSKTDLIIEQKRIEALNFLKISISQNAVSQIERDHSLAPIWQEWLSKYADDANFVENREAI